MNASPRLLVFALICVMASAGRAQNIEQTQKGVVQIVATAADGNRRTGTGFVVRATRDTAQIVTASHVVEGARQIDVHFFTQRATPVAARVIALEGGDLQGIAALSVTSAVPAGPGP
jgi:S1-C subfamily serine protease